MDTQSTCPSRAFRRIGLLILLSQFAACGGGGNSPGPAAPTPPAAPPPQPVATFAVNPKYFIGSVIYMPPAAGSSIDYGFGTVIGTTVSTTGNWSKGSVAGSQIGLQLPTGDSPITFGDGFGGATTQSVDMQDSFANMSVTFAPPGSDAINHDYDQILLFLGINVNASVDILGNVTWGMDFSQILNQRFATSGYFVALGCLRPNSTIFTDPVCTSDRNGLGSLGITAADYPSIVGADPFADPNAPQTPDPSRYVFVTRFQYAFQPAGSSLTAMLTNSSNAGNSQTSTYSYSVSAAPGASYDGVSLKDPGKFTWTNSSTPSNKTGSSNQSITLVLAQPSASYSGPFTLFVYVDAIYKTFMFSFAPPLP
jgi:hypothetical protein